MKLGKPKSGKGPESIFFLLIFSLMAMNVGAVEPIKESFQLWVDDDSLIDNRFIGFDFDPSTAEIELIVAGEAGRTILPPVGGKVRGAIRIRFKVHSADGTSLIIKSPVINMRSEPYPDPGDPVNQEGGANETFYSSRDGFFSSIPFGTSQAEARNRVLDNAEVPIGFGIAATNGGATRTFVFGIAVDISYSNFSEGFVDASRYKFASFDATTLTKLCESQLRGTDITGWEIEPSAAGVSNYLATTRPNDDEVRIHRIKERVGFERSQHIFYDPRTCVILATSDKIAPIL